MRITSNRTIGFEVEFVAGDSGSLGRLGEVKGDGSITLTDSQRDDDLTAYEFASDPTQGHTFLKYLGQVCMELDAIGARVNRSCGLHIHCGLNTSERTNGHLAALADYFADVEPILLNMVTPSRRNNQYCRKIGIDSSERQYRHDTPKRQSLNTLFDMRYHSINLAASFAHGTAEIRLHHATTQYRIIAGWASMMVSLVDSALERYKRDYSTSSFPPNGTSRERIIYAFRSAALPLSTRKYAVKQLRTHADTSFMARLKTARGGY